MARFLFASHPVTGHVLPALPIVSCLVARGHEVVWYSGKKFQSKVEAVGARFAPYSAAYDYDDDDYDVAFPGRGALKGIAQISFDFINIFAKQVGPMYHDLTAILRDFPADAVVGDPAVVAARAVSARGGPPHAMYNITVLAAKSPELAPFGLGVLPDGSLLGRLRNRALYTLANRIVFRGATEEFSRQLVAIGLPPTTFTDVFDSDYLILEPTVAGFEYFRSQQHPNVHFIGPLLPPAPRDFTRPAWWLDVVERRRPVVLVTQGTVATNARELIAPTLRGLADENALVIAAGVRDLASLGPIPANVRVEAFVPFAALLPHVDVYVTNGGFGGVQFALANGVPIVVAGVTEDKPEVGNRVEYSGVGINLRTATPSPEQVRNAVRRIIDDKRYRKRARVLQAEMAACDAPLHASLLLERLAATGLPVKAGTFTAAGLSPALQSPAVG